MELPSLKRTRGLVTGLTIRHLIIGGLVLICCSYFALPLSKCKMLRSTSSTIEKLKSPSTSIISICKNKLTNAHSGIWEFHLEPPWPQLETRKDKKRRPLKHTLVDSSPRLQAGVFPNRARNSRGVVTLHRFTVRGLSGHRYIPSIMVQPFLPRLIPKRQAD